MSATNSIIEMGEPVRPVVRGPVMELLLARGDYWKRVRSGNALLPAIRQIALFIIVASALYGATLAAWRSPELALYVAIKLPILMLGTTSIVMMLNWMTATMLHAGLSFRQVVGVTWGSMGVACWILLGLSPVTLFFTLTAAPSGAATGQEAVAHNFLLATHMVLIATAGVWGNEKLYQGLREVAAPGCRVRQLNLLWLAAFGLVGCQLAWILRPFIGSPFYDVVFLRENALDRNVYEFLFQDVLPRIARTIFQ